MITKVHVGAREYVKSFGFGSKLILAVLVNPMNIVALPQYDHSKIRTCEYFPYAVMAMGDEEWEEIEGSYFEEDYCNYEQEHIEEILANIETPEDVEANEEELEQCRNRLVSLYPKADEEN